MYYLNRCAFTPVAYTSTDDFVVDTGAPVDGFYDPASCANPEVVDGGLYHYFVESSDKSQHEEGDALWDEATGTLLRATGTVRASSASGARVTFLAPPTVHMGGPAASDIGFRGYETFTTGASSVTINPDVFASWVTTDGTGERSISLPEMDEKSTGLEHMIMMVSQADPGDTIACGDADHTITLDGVGAFVLLRWNGFNFIWEAIDSSGGAAFSATSEALWLRSTSGRFKLVNVPDLYSGATIGPFQMLRSSNTGAVSFLDIPPSDIFTWNTKVTSAASTAIPGMQGFKYNLKITSGGTAGAEPVVVDTPGITGQRFLVTFTTQTDGADSISFDTTNIKQAGATPSIVQLFAQGDEILLEWRKPYWEVIHASAGVVTP